MSLRGKFKPGAAMIVAATAAIGVAGLLLASEDDVVDAPILELVHHPQPELGAFGLLDPDAQNVLLTLAIER